MRKNVSVAVVPARGDKMQLVEQHVISKSDPRYAAIDAAAFASKNLYNAALYLIRQAYILEGRYLPYQAVQKRMQSHEAYKALPAKVSQQVLIQLAHDWESFFKALKAYKADPSKFEERPKIPGYKHKSTGRNLLIYTIQALQGGQSKKGIQGLIKPWGLALEVHTRQQHIQQVRIVPHKGYYVVEVVYPKAVIAAPVNPAYYAGIDLGVNNLAALASNKPGFVPVVINGRPVKSTNQFYNKRKAELQSKLGH